MLILGPGGTGKSKLIKAITETFKHYGKDDILAKCATTGIAATDIGGRTLHSWMCLTHSIPKGNDWIEKPAKATSEKRQLNIGGKEFIIIDEISMADKAMLYCTLEIVGWTMGKEGKGSADDPFGGANVILTGDFHQFPPVGNASGALYVDKAEDSKQAQIGRVIFKQFNTVVILDKQNRVTDVKWANILSKLCVGQCDHNDLEEIQKLILSNPDYIKPNFQEMPWSDAILVTPRHAVCKAWNEHSVVKHCKKTGNRQYLVPAYDIDKEMNQELPMEARLAAAKAKSAHTGKLADRVEVAVGMKARCSSTLRLKRISQMGQEVSFTI
jgi:energy-coupling factor transporter ATP-binding protein EcfA2